MDMDNQLHKTRVNHVTPTLYNDPKNVNHMEISIQIEVIQQSVINMSLCCFTLDFTFDKVPSTSCTNMC